jgi:hypothetical protein
MSQIIPFPLSYKSKSVLKRQTASKQPIAFQFNNDDLICLSDALLYYGGVLGEQPINATDSTSNENDQIKIKKGYLTRLYMKISKENGFVTFLFNNDDIGCLAESLMYYSTFVGSQADATSRKQDKEQAIAKKGYVIKLYTQISEFFIYE